MATSAEELVGLTLWQIIIGTSGVGLLIYTLYLTRDSNKAAIRAAKAAEDSVAVASDTAKHQLRAYVLPEKVSFLTNETGNLQIAVKLQNTGQTPARKIRHMTRCGVGIPTAKGFNYDIPADRIFGDIGPNQPTSGLFYQTDGNDFIGYRDLILSGQKVLYVWGRVKYFDIFGREQTTNYTFRWSPEHDDFVACDEGNEAT